MVVDDLNVFGSSSGPARADPLLLVDPDAGGLGAVTLEFLEMVDWGDSEVAQGIGGIEDHQLPQRHPLGVLVQLPDPLPLPDTLGVPVSKRPQHQPSTTTTVNNAKRYVWSHPPSAMVIIPSRWGIVLRKRSAVLAVSIATVSNVNDADHVLLVVDAVDHAAGAPARTVPVLQRRVKSLAHVVRVAQRAHLARAGLAIRITQLIYRTVI
ncbi:MAG: hypothetical protein ACYCYA_03365 [Actinomycetes bacterium]